MNSFDLINLWKIFNYKEKRNFSILIFLIGILAILQSAGVLSILPFMYVLMDPTIIETNTIIASLKTFLKIENDQNILIILGLFSIFSLFISNFFSIIVLYLTTFFSYMHGHRLSVKLFDLYLSKNYLFFLKNSSSELLKNVTEEIDRYVGGVIMPLIKGISKLFSSVILILVLIFVNAKIAIITFLIFAPIYIFIYIYFKFKIIESGKSLEIAISNRHKIINLGFRAIKYIKLIGSELYWQKKYVSQSFLKAKFYSKNQFIGQSPPFIVETIAYAGLIFIIIFLISLEQNTALIPSLALFSIAAYKIAPAIHQIYSSYVKITFHFDSFYKLYTEFVLEKIDFQINNNDNNNNQKSFFYSKKITLKNLSFKYNNEENYILKNINLEITKNTTFGIVGESGSGKTTLLDILIGLLLNYEGSIIVDDTKLNNVNLKLWQKKISYVPQNIYMTDESIMSNIAFSENHIDQEKVWKCIEMVGLREFINSLPHKLNTNFGDSGVQLSGGQKQRIGIARAIYRDPEVLILDEATNSLDKKTEKKILDMLEKFSANKTVIFVSHDINAIKFCKKIYNVKTNTITIK